MILLTGSNGFIGSHFKKVLDASLVLEVDQKECSSFLQEFDHWDELDLILHQGAITSTTERDPSLLHKYNVEYSIRLFEKAIEFGIPVKYASSASVYGNTRGNVNPLNQYSISKLIVDYWVNDNIDRFSLIQGFRYFNVYGSGEEHKGDQASPVSKFTKQALETGTINVFEGSENYLRDFICVSDIVDVVLNNNSSSGIYDLGTGKPTSFRSVGDCVANKYSAKVQEIPFPEHLKSKYQFDTCADMSWLNHKFTTIEEYLK